MANFIRFALALSLPPMAMLPSVAAAQGKLDAAKAAEAFGAREQILDVSISPAGDKLAIVVPGPKQSTSVIVSDLKTGASAPVNMANGDPMTLTGCNWASEDRIVCRLYGVSNANYDRYLGYSRIIAMDATGQNPLRLGAYQREQEYASTSDGYVIDWRDGASTSVLMARRYVPGRAGGLDSASSLAEGLAVDLLDTRTGKATRVESPGRDIAGYISDGQGNIRLKAANVTDGDGQLLGLVNFSYRLSDSKSWRPFSTYNSSKDEGLYPIAVDGTANVAYALEKVDGRKALYRVSLDGAMTRQLVLANPRVDIDGVETLGRRGRVVGALYSDERPHVDYFDPAYRALIAKLTRALPAYPIIRIVDSSADESVHVVYAISDERAGRYFIYDAKAKTLSVLGDDRPALSDIPLGTMRSMTYKAADGTGIPAYLTLPPGGEGRKLPTIVMPHGGPASRDEWGFDWLVQFFVHRGYAVFQPNYRGSTGYGEKWFMDNGFRSWKAAIGDVNDAGRWLVQQGFADPAKLAIVGWSYGGYAALQANVLDPQLFKAAVAIAPVTDFRMLRGESSQFTNAKLSREFIGSGPELDAGSPLQHADVFRAPVLIFHGEKDVNVGIAESRAMERALTKAGKQVRLVAYPAIDHQLRDSAVRADMLGQIDKFLTDKLKP